MISQVANRYAEALFQLAEEENQLSEIYSEIEDLNKLILDNKKGACYKWAPLVHYKYFTISKTTQITIKSPNVIFVSHLSAFVLCVVLKAVARLSCLGACQNINSSNSNPSIINSVFI